MSRTRYNSRERSRLFARLSISIVLRFPPPIHIIPSVLLEQVQFVGSTSIYRYRAHRLSAPMIPAQDHHPILGLIRRFPNRFATLPWSEYRLSVEDVLYSVPSCRTRPDHRPRISCSLPLPHRYSILRTTGICPPIWATLVRSCCIHRLFSPLP